MGGKLITTIIFDVDGTLYDETHAKIKAELKTAEWISKQLDYSMEEVYRVFKRSKAIILKEYAGFSERNNRVRWYEKTFEELGISELLASDAKDYYWDVVLGDIEPYFDLKLIIPTLAQNYKLYILTDELLDIQIKKLKRLGLDSYFEKLVSSEVIGKTKPSQELFEYMIDVVGEPADSMVMIGDNPTADIVGANNVSIHSVWLKRGKYSCYSYPSDNQPEITLNNYLELLDKLKDI